VGLSIAVLGGQLGAPVFCLPLVHPGIITRFELLAFAPCEG
jgi:hypothetical protein